MKLRVREHTVVWQAASKATSGDCGRDPSLYSLCDDHADDVNDDVQGRLPIYFRKDAPILRLSGCQWFMQVRSHGTGERAPPPSNGLSPPPKCRPPRPRKLI